MRAASAVLATLLLAAPLAAQERDTFPAASPEAPTIAAPERPISGSTVFLGATLGSVAGLALGASGGGSLGIGGGDDPGLAGAIGGAVIGSAVGTALGVYVGSGARARLGTVATAGVVSILGAFAGASIAGHVFDDAAPMLIGYSIGQGAVATFVTRVLED